MIFALPSFPRALRPACFLLCLIAPFVARGNEPLGLLLTWVDDPLRSIVIDWQTLASEEGHSLEFRERGVHDSWQSASAEAIPFPFSDRTIHRVHLRDLSPGTEYDFRMEGFERIYYFRTMPEDNLAPITIALGGDTRHRKEWMDAMNIQAMRYDPDFIVWGGDLAYADGREDRLHRWIEWFDSVREILITPEGRVVPIVVCIGNHEVRGGYIWGAGRGDDGYEPTDDFRASIAPYYYALFAFPGQPGYAALDFGNYLSLIFLDTDHANPVPGEQTEWLRRALAERSGVFGQILPVYHVPAYPSARPFDGRVNQRVREHWVPLFEEYGVRFAFENHDHTYKRTLPLRQHRPSENGVIYFGDGAWGVGTREVRPVEDYGYMARVESVRHAIIMTLQAGHATFEVISEHGTIIDRFPESRSAAPAGVSD